MWPTPNVIGLPFDARFGRWGGDQSRLYSPTQLPNLAAWFDALDTQTMLTGAGTTITDGDAVALWADKSGNSGVNCLVKPATSGNYAGITALAAAGSGAFSVSFCINLSVLDTANGGVISGAANSFQLKVRTDGTLLVTLVGVADVGTSTGAVTAFTRRVVGYTRTGTTGTFYIDGVAAGTITDNRNYSVGNTVIAAGTGGGFGMEGKMFWARVYSAALDATAMAADAAGTVQADNVLDIDFSTSTKKLANGDTFTCATGQTVTLNSSGATGARIAGERDLFQGTAANRPVWLQYAGTKYGYLNGTAGNYFSTPNSAAINAVTTDFTIVVNLETTYASGGIQNILTKRNAAGTAAVTQWQSRIDATGELRLVVSDGASTSFGGVSTAAVPVGTKWVKITFDADNGAGGSDTIFYTSTATARPSGAGWTKLGNTVTVASTLTAINAVATPAVVGALSDDGAAQRLTGRVFYAEFASGIDGTAVIAFNPAIYTSGTTFTASTGEVWTVNGGAHIVTRTGLYGNGSTTAMQPARYSAAQPVTTVVFGEQVSWTSGDYIIDGGAANTGAIIQTTSTPQVNISAGSSVAGNTGWLLKTFGMVRAVFNGASSELAVNRTAATTGNAGAGAPNGLTVWASGGLANNGNAFISEIAQFTRAIGTAEGGRLAIYGGRKYGYTP